MLKGQRDSLQIPYTFVAAPAPFPPTQCLPTGFRIDVFAMPRPPPRYAPTGLPVQLPGAEDGPAAVFALDPTWPMRQPLSAQCPMALLSAHHLPGVPITSVAVHTVWIGSSSADGTGDDAVHVALIASLTVFLGLFPYALGLLAYLYLELPPRMGSGVLAGVLLICMTRKQSH